MSSNNHIASKIRHLFIHDDGSLPDIFITNLDEESFRKVYLKAISLGLKDDRISAWNIKEEKEVEYTNSEYLDLFISDEVESSRVNLPDLKVDKVFVPISSLSVYCKEEVEFDYRMGNEWTDDTISALLEFIALLKDKAPNLKVKRADEWLAPKTLRFKNNNLISENYKIPSDGIFSQTFNEYYSLTRSNKN